MIKHRRVGLWRRKSGAMAAVVAALMAGVGSLVAAAPELAAQQAAKSAVFTQPTYSSPIALSADNQLVWSVNPDDNSVSVVRTDTNTLLRTIRVGKEPQSVALAPNNKFAFVANAAANSVTVIKINNPSVGGFAAVVEKTIRTGAEPWNIVISPDGKRVFVANSGQDTISVINALTRNLIGNVRLRSSLCNEGDGARHFQPRGLAVSLDSKQLYVTRFLSFTKPGGVQGDDDGKQGVVCRLDINTASPTPRRLQAGRSDPAARAGDRLQHRGQQHGCPQHRLDRLSQPAAEHRAARHQGLPAQHRRLARKPAAVPELDAGLRQCHRGRRRCLSDQSAGIESAPGGTGSRGRQEEAVLCQPLGHRLHHAEWCRYRLRDLRR